MINEPTKEDEDSAELIVTKVELLSVIEDTEKYIKKLSSMIESGSLDAVSETECQRIIALFKEDKEKALEILENIKKMEAW